MSATAAVLYAPVVTDSLIISPPQLTARSWLFLAGTGILQVGYFLFLQRAYRAGDLSAVYPIGRGTGALLAAVAGIVLLGERPGPATLAGIALLVGGVIVLGMPGRRPGPGSRPPAGPGGGGAAMPPAAVGFALVTGLFIATYTIWDKIAVTTVGNPPLLQGYASVLGVAVMLTPVALADRGRLRQAWQRYRRQAVGAGLLSPLAYILVLVAMTFTSVAVVAPAREVSVLVGVLLGRRLLGEGGLARRLAGAAAIVAGIIAVALG
jgi:drug/metabolite transporter (DMT)-like permease